MLHPDGSLEQLRHDAEGRLLAHIDALGRATHYGYDASGQIAQRTDAVGDVLGYRWDLLGRLRELVNENGARYRFAYDPMGRLLEEVGFDGRPTAYRYTPESGVLAQVAEAGHTTDLAFDPLGRRIGAEAESFGYDRNGRLIEARNPQARLQWFYDPAGNLVREHQGDIAQDHTAVWQHRYDELNQRSGSTRPDGHTLEWLTYGSGHVHGLMLDGLEVVGFERDALHRETGRTQANGLMQRQAYDPLGRLLSQQIGPRELQAESASGARGASAERYEFHSKSIASTGTRIQRRYVYDRAGQFTGIADSRRGRLDYRYDPVGRLLEAHSALGEEVFAFDPAGNIGEPVADTRPGGEYFDAALPRAQRRRSFTTPKVLDNLIKDYAGTHYRWDARGNLIERTRNRSRSTFAWDGFNRLRSATTEQGTTTFRYDPLGRRIGKTRPDASEVSFGWDGDTLAYESGRATHARGGHAGTHNARLAGDDTDTAQAAGFTVHYIHEKDSFVPLAQLRRQGAMRLPQTTDVKALMSANDGRYDVEQDPIWNGQALAQTQAAPFGADELLHYQCDHLGTPQELTDHEGRIAWSANYKAWGEAKTVIGEAARKAGIENPIRFQGQYLDEETGLHYNRYRYYDPLSGRFVSKDPIGLLGGINLQQYAPNPIEWIDPLGLMSNGITPNNQGSRTIIQPGNASESTIGYSTRAGGGGASHPVVRELYDSVAPEQRSPFHGDCGEADGLSKIATAHNVQSIDELRSITAGGTTETHRNDGKLLGCCSSCRVATGRIGLRDKSGIK